MVRAPPSGAARHAKTTIRVTAARPGRSAAAATSPRGTAHARKSAHGPVLLPVRATRLTEVAPPQGRARRVPDGVHPLRRLAPARRAPRRHERRRALRQRGLELRQTRAPRARDGRVPRGRDPAGGDPPAECRPARRVRERRGLGARPARGPRDPAAARRVPAPAQRRPSSRG